MESFPSFPVEIVQELVHYLTHDWVGLNGPAAADDPPPRGIFRSWRKVNGASKYATVNKIWQDAIERETFAELHLNLTRLGEADAIINGVPRRQKYVRSIWLNVELPSRQPDSPQDDNQTLQDTFKAFLSTLQHWTPGPPVRVQLNAYALADKARWNDSPGRSTMPQPSHDPPLELLDHDKILSHAPVHVVTEIGMERNRVFGRRVSPASVCALVARLPACKKISLNSWWDDDDDDDDAKVRNALGKAVRNITHPIDHFHIAGFYSDVDAGSSRQPEAGPDELSESLGLLSLRVQKLDLYNIVVSDDLFLQHPLSSQLSLPAHWARLEHFALYYPPVTPSGTRLFVPDSGVTDSLLRRLYLAAANAALEMPLLKSMTLVADLRAGEEWHKFCYLCGPKKRRKTVTAKRTATAIWTSSSGFAPGDEVLEAWKAVPQQNMMGTELNVQVLDDEDAV